MDGLKYLLPRPPLDLGPEEKARLAACHPTELAAIDHIPKWKMLGFLSDQDRFLFHGTSDPKIERFMPRQCRDAHAFGAQNAVYASSDGIWAMFYAILDRNPPFSLHNSAIRFVEESGEQSQPFYFFSIEKEARARDAFSDGFIYVLPRETFVRDPIDRVCGRRIVIEHWASTEPVQPLAVIPVAVSDFPFLEQIRGHDDETLWTRMEDGFDCYPWVDEQYCVSS